MCQQDQEWKCLYGEYRLPFLTTPYFLIASRYDSFQLSHDLETRPNMVALPPYTGELLAYADVFGKHSMRVLSGLPVAVASVPAAVGKTRAIMAAGSEGVVMAPTWQVRHTCSTLATPWRGSIGMLDNRTARAEVRVAS
jgi:hypothetical protein